MNEEQRYRGRMLGFSLLIDNEKETTRSRPALSLQLGAQQFYNMGRELQILPLFSFSHIHIQLVAK